MLTQVSDYLILKKERPSHGTVPSPRTTPTPSGPHTLKPSPPSYRYDVVTDPLQIPHKPPEPTQHHHPTTTPTSTVGSDRSKDSSNTPVQ